MLLAERATQTWYCASRADSFTGRVSFVIRAGTHPRG